jgi:alpha-methylacyl-CoA racemase
VGALTGVRVIEFAGRGPGPFAGMLLSDMGAEVIRIDRPDAEAREQSPDPRLELVSRGRRSIALDLKRPEAVEVALRLVDGAEVVFEGFRPGVMERLGLGPEVCHARNPALVYARMTGWGQDGPLAHVAGHDINYIAVAGALDPIGRAGGPPVPPLNLVGDYAGGGMLAAFGIVCALIEARASGQGQVIDAAMVDGASLLMTIIHGRRQMGVWRDQRGTNHLDSGAAFYEVYETKDGRHVAVGAIERRFYTRLLELLDLDPDTLPPRTPDRWSELKRILAERFRERTRDEWVEHFGDQDACFAPVLSLAEVHEHPHHRARQGFLEIDGVLYPAPAPRLSRTPARIAGPPPAPGEHGEAILRDEGFTDSHIQALRDSRALR